MKPAYNRLLILPFQARWAARERLRRGQTIWGAGPVSADDPGWQAAPPVRIDLAAAYRLLGLDPTASASEVKRRYWALALEHHPDRGGDVAKFHAISEAKERLLGRS